MAPNYSCFFLQICYARASVTVWGPVRETTDGYTIYRKYTETYLQT